MRIDCCVSYFQKQLIGLLPNGQECLFYYAPDINIDGYRIDGIIYDDYTVIDADLNPNGIYYNLSYIPSSGEPRFVLTYVGTEPPTYLPSITDSNDDPVVWNWTNYCTKVCLEGTFSALDSTFFENGYGWNSYGVAAFDDQVVVETFLKSLYGQQTLYSYVDNGDGTFYIKIDNAFILSPIAWSADDVTYQDMVACGTPNCLFSTAAIADSTGPSCFTDPTWDFNGQGVDFNAAAALYGGYAVNDGDTSYLPFGGDLCSKVNFLYIGQSIPPAINIVDPIFGNYQRPIGFLYCSFGCLTTNSIYCKDLIYYGMQFTDLINVAFTSYGATSIDLNLDLMGSESTLNAVLSKYIPGSSVNITNDGGDYYTFTFNNVYYNITNLTIQLFDNTSNTLVNETLVPC